MALFRRTGSNHGTYQARKPENKCWSSISGHDDAERRKFFAPKESNLPADAFADDVVDNDVGVYYTRHTELHSFGSTLGDHEDGYDQNERRKKNRENKRNEQIRLA